MQMNFNLSVAKCAEIDCIGGALNGNSYVRLLAYLFIYWFFRTSKYFERMKIDTPCSPVAEIKGLNTNLWAKVTREHHFLSMYRHRHISCQPRKRRRMGNFKMSLSASADRQTDF